jgi:hypothetical protein
MNERVGLDLLCCTDDIHGVAGPSTIKMIPPVLLLIYLSLWLTDTDIHTYIYICPYHLFDG